MLEFVLNISSQVLLLMHGFCSITVLEEVSCHFVLEITVVLDVLLQSGIIGLTGRSSTNPVGDNLGSVFEVKLLPSWLGTGGLLDVVEGAVNCGLVHVINLLFGFEVLLNLTNELLIFLDNGGFVLSIPLLDVLIKLLESVNIVINGLFEISLSFSWGRWHEHSLIDGHHFSWSVNFDSVESVVLNDLMNDLIELSV